MSEGRAPLRSTALVSGIDPTRNSVSRFAARRAGSSLGTPGLDAHVRSQVEPALSSRGTQLVVMASSGSHEPSAAPRDHPGQAQREVIWAGSITSQHLASIWRAVPSCQSIACRGRCAESRVTLPRRTRTPAPGSRFTWAKATCARCDTPAGVPTIFSARGSREHLLDLVGWCDTAGYRRASMRAKGRTRPPWWAAVSDSIRSVISKGAFARCAERSLMLASFPTLLVDRVKVDFGG